MCLEAYGELKFLPNIYTRQIKSGRLRGKAAVDQKLQITHQNPTNLAENTNLKSGRNSNTNLSFRKTST